MIRKVDLLTETKSEEFSNNHQTIEIAGIEIIDGVVFTKRHHIYLNSGEEVDADATDVNDLTHDITQSC